MLQDEEYVLLERAVIDYNENSNLEGALEVFQKLSLKPYDDDVAQFYLGLMYYHGDIVEKSRDQAAFWWKKSAAKKNLDAAFQLASISLTKNTRY